jgi:hypothetical protein
MPPEHSSVVLTPNHAIESTLAAYAAIKQQWTVGNRIIPFIGLKSAQLMVYSTGFVETPHAA